MKEKLTEEKKKEKLNNYKERNKFWTNQAINQFGYSINLFFTLGLAFLSFQVSKRIEFDELYIDCKCGVNLKLIFYYISIFSVFLSVLFGGFSVISRLTDLRITRHILDTRIKTIETFSYTIPSEPRKNCEDNFFEKICFLYKIEKKFIIEKDFENFETVSIKFQNLRELNNKIGKFSWELHKKQVICLVISLIAYGLIAM